MDIYIVIYDIVAIRSPSYLSISNLCTSASQSLSLILLHNNLFPSHKGLLEFEHFTSKAERVREAATRRLLLKLRSATVRSKKEQDVKLEISKEKTKTPRAGGYRPKGNLYTRHPPV